MLFSYNWLKDYIKGELPSPKKLAEILTQHSFEIESIKKRGKDWVFAIDVLPNRACDCLSHIGIAREVCALTSSNFLFPVFKLKQDKNLKTKDFVEIEIKNEADCPRYTAKVILGVKVKPSPKWIQERLKACGLQSINNIVDITNYVMLETGQPLHAFDLDKIEKKIIVRRAKQGEKIKAIGGEVYKIDKDILMIADEKKVLAIAGVKGGEQAEISSKTKNILIEAANFEQKIIRKASKKLKLKTDASWRFENGIDPNLIDWAQQRVCFLIQEASGGQVVQGMADFYSRKIKPKKIQLDLDYTQKLLGIEIPKARIIKILKSLGFGIQNERSERASIEVPTFRLDVSIQEDLIEEVGRVLGYQNIPSIYPQVALIPPQKNESILWQKTCQDILKELGFSEVYNYSFIGEKEKEVFGLSEKELIELENPMSSLNKYLRPTLLINLIKNAKENLKNFEEIKIFELGKIFRKKQGKEPEEKEMLSGLLIRKKADVTDEGFYLLKGIIDSLFNKIGISDILYHDFERVPEGLKIEFWHSQKRAQIKINREAIGFLGEVSPKILKDLNIKKKVFAFALDFEKIIKVALEEQEYRPISSYPAAVRDLAILVPHNVKVVEVLNQINIAGGKLVRDVDLFDMYKGEEIPRGKQNLAFHIIYQSENKTLSSKEVDNLHQKIVRSLEKNLLWEVRK